MNAITIEQFRVERDQIRATYGDSSKDAGAHLSMELAKLFYRAYEGGGVTQRQLADEESMSLGKVSYHLLFGEFQTLFDLSNKPRTAGAFDKLWRATVERTDKGIKFTQVNDMIDNPPEETAKAEGRPSLLDAFPQDGKFHTDAMYAKKMGVTPKLVEKKAKSLKLAGEKQIPPKVEIKGHGKGVQIAVFKTDKVVRLSEILAKFGPLLDALQHQGKQHIASYSPNDVLLDVHKMKRFIEEWSE